MQCLRCTFKHNQAAGGGALYVHDLSRPVFTECLFDGNLAFGGLAGGAVHASSYGAPQFVKCVFASNIATHNVTRQAKKRTGLLGVTASAGGAISFSGGATGNVSMCNFTCNMAAVGVSGRCIVVWSESGCDTGSNRYRGRSTRALQMQFRTGNRRLPLIVCAGVRLILCVSESGSHYKHLSCPPDLRRRWSNEYCRR